MTEQEKLIWAAGFFDGEGCTSIAKQSTKYGKDRALTSTNYCLGVSICQKVKEPLDVFHQFFGGHLYSYEVKGVTYWRWHTWSAGALHVLQTLKPYLILKAERARVCIDFQVDLTKWNAEYGRRGYPDFVKQARESYFVWMRDLNKRGVSADNPTPKTPGAKKGCSNYFAQKSKEKETEVVQ